MRPLMILALLTACGPDRADKSTAADLPGDPADDTGAAAGDEGDEAMDCPPYTEPDGTGDCVDIDECAEDNGGCGDALYWSCTNNEAAPPTCADVLECAEDNGGCGDPEVFACVEQEGAPPLCDYDATADQAWLLEGVEELVFGGSLPSRMVVWGETAFPLVATEADQVVVAGARVGAGKALHFGHEGQLSGAATVEGDGGRIVENALSWMNLDDGAVAVDPGMGALADWLEGLGHTVVRMDSETPDLTAFAEAEVRVWATTSYPEHAPETDAAIADWLRSGGSVISGGHAWWWAYSTGSTDPYTDHPGNQWLGAAGLTLTGLTADGAAAIPVDGTPSPLLHAGLGLAAARDHIDELAILDEEGIRLATTSAGLAASVLPLGSPWFLEARTMLEAGAAPVPTEDDPVEPANEPVPAFFVQLQDALNARLPAAELAADPAAADFPGAVTTTDSASWAVELDLSYGGRDSRYAFSGAGAPVWRSTGIYLAPGQKVAVRVPEAVVDSGVDVQIGSHTDTIWHTESWSRSPSVVRRYALDEVSVLVASAHGGLLYLRVPAGVDLGPVTVSGDGGHPAARYVAGETAASDWQEAAATTGAPWAELETGDLVLTVPTETARDLEDPAPLLAFWQEVMDAQAELGGLTGPRARAERIVTDRQISAGWMHSGYPIMAHNASAPDLVNLDQLSVSGDWGAFHELGHNHQWRAWHVDGATEATCNLWSVHTMEEVVGLDRSAAHSAMADSDRQARVDSYLAGGADFAGSWSVWTALETYLQLQEAFGWEPLIAVQQQYLADDPADDPTTQAGVIDRWVQRSSEATGRDLGAFYLAWGWPVQPSTLAAVDHLPDWTDHPMQ